MKTIVLGLLLTVCAPWASAEYSRTYIESHALQTAPVNGLEMAYRIVGEGPDKP